MLYLSQTLFELVLLLKHLHHKSLRLKLLVLTSPSIANSMKPSIIWRVVQQRLPLKSLRTALSKTTRLLRLLSPSLLKIRELSCYASKFLKQPKLEQVSASEIPSLNAEQLIAPVLSLHVTRSQWQSDPDPSRWTTYYRSAEALLLFDNGDHTAAQAGTANPNAQPGQSANNNPGQSGGSVNPSSSGGGVSNTSTPNQPGDSSSTNGRNGTPTIPGQPANNSPLSPGHAGQPATNSPYPPGQPNNSNPGQSRGNVNTPTSPRRPFYRFPNESGNPTSTSGRNGTYNAPSPSQPNFTSPSTPGESVNQPTTTNPSTSGQPSGQPATNNSSTPGQSGVVNSTPSPNTTPAPGSGMTPTPPTAVPVGSPSSSTGSSPADGSSPSGSSTATPSNGQSISTPANGQIASSIPPIFSKSEWH